MSKDETSSTVARGAAGRVRTGHANDELNDSNSSSDVQRNRYVSRPESADVLIGRGKPFQNHPGNIRMRRLVGEYKELYTSSHRDMRKVVALKVLDTLVQGGARFLKRRRSFYGTGGNEIDVGDEEIPGWVIANQDEACEKLCHALRAKPPRKQNSPVNNEQVSRPKSSIKKKQARQSSPTSMPQERVSTACQNTLGMATPSFLGSLHNGDEGRSFLRHHSAIEALPPRSTSHTMRNLAMLMGMPTIQAAALAPPWPQRRADASYGGLQQATEYNPSLQALLSRQSNVTALAPPLQRYDTSIAQRGRTATSEELAAALNPRAVGQFLRYPSDLVRR